jgi:hypothetical protein
MVLNCEYGVQQEKKGQEKKECITLVREIITVL